MSKQIDFINKIKDGAIASMKNHGVLASITIAQAILESSWGESGLSIKANNLFGIKATGNEPYITMQTAEYSRGEKYYINAKFRKYNSYTASIEDHAKFLVENPRYKRYGLFNTNDYKGQTNALVKAGYATDPNYDNLLIQLIEQYGLSKYDNADTKGKYTINYCLEWQKFYNKTTQTKLPIREDGEYGPNTQKSLDNLIAYIRQGKKYKYCFEFQCWYNSTTKTRAQLDEDGICGPATEKAIEIIRNIISEF